MAKATSLPTLSFVIATKDRPAELNRLLQSLSNQTIIPDEVIIVDGGTISIKEPIRSHSELNIIYLKCLPPSAAKQRNVGISHVSQSIELIGVLDDDSVFEGDSVERMLAFWKTASPKIGGAAFNLANHPALSLPKLKKSFLAEWMGLYSPKAGIVMRSGFQTMIGYIKETIYVQWLSSGASVFKKQVFDEFQFDNWFSGYSYLEDLDFSYRIGKKYELVIVGDAKYYHFPKASQRLDEKEFGKREVRNRLYFVKKNPELSLLYCYIALFSRFVITMLEWTRNKRNIRRAWGNILGLLHS